MGASVSVPQLRQFLRSDHPPLVIDVRPAADFFADSVVFAGALRRDPDDVGAWAAELPQASAIVACCAQGREASPRVAAALARAGIAAKYLEGGLEAWKAAGGAVFAKPAGAGTPRPTAFPACAFRTSGRSAASMRFWRPTGFAIRRSTGSQ